MEILKVTKENIDKEHICCSLSSNKDCGVLAKKQWIKDRFDDGLVFLKGNVRGKCFIEYIPAEKAWAPIDAEGYMYINCLWVSGKYKGQGNSTLLLNECIKDSKSQGKKGIVVLSSTKKLPFLSDKKYLEHKGFKSADFCNPQYELMYLPFDESHKAPKFKPCAKYGEVDDKGFVLYYTHQCPFTAKYVPLIENIAKEKGLDFKAIKIDSLAMAQNAPAPFTTYSLFYNGEFITNEILSEKRFNKIIEKFIL